MSVLGARLEGSIVSLHLDFSSTSVLFTNSTLVLSSSFSPHTLVSSGFIPCWKIYRYIFFFQSSATDNLLETKPPIVASMAIHMVTDELEDVCLVIKIKSIFSYSTIISV